MESGRYIDIFFLHFLGGGELQIWGYTPQCTMLIPDGLRGTYGVPEIEHGQPHARRLGIPAMLPPAHRNIFKLIFSNHLYKHLIEYSFSLYFGFGATLMVLRRGVASSTVLQDHPAPALLGEPLSAGY